MQIFTDTILFFYFHSVLLGFHGLYGLGLLFHEPLSAIPISEYVQIGYMRALKLKTIYVCRYWARDNFLWQGWLDQIHKELIADLEAKGAKKDNDQVYEIPHFDVDAIDGAKFFQDYVKMGRPAILRKVNVAAMKWNSEYLLAKAGNFSTPMRCMDGSVVTQTIEQYIASRVEIQYNAFTR